jgi:hypothetical protein
MANEGFTEREISERTGHPKTTVHRDLAGYEKSQAPAVDTAAADTSDRQKADELQAEADRLTKIQKRERGSQPGPVIDGKQTLIPGPYVPSEENEARAAQIISLRKQAANLRFPVAT